MAQNSPKTSLSSTFSLTTDKMYQLAEPIEKQCSIEESLKNRLRELEDEIEAYKESDVDQQKLISSLQEEIQKYQNEIRKLKQDMALKQVELNQFCDASMPIKRVAMYNKDVQTEKFIDRAQQILTQQLHEQTIHQSDLKQLLQSKEALIIEIKARQDTIKNHFELKIADSIKSLSNYEQQNTQLKQQVFDCQEEISKLRQLQIEAQNEYSQQLQQNQQMLESKQASIDHLQQMLAKQTQRNSEERISYQGAQIGEKEVLIDKIMRQKQELSSLQEQIKLQTSKLQTILTENSSLKQNIENICYTHQKNMQEIKESHEIIMKERKHDFDFQLQKANMLQKDKILQIEVENELKLKLTKEKERRHELELLKKDQLIQDIRDQRQQLEFVLKTKDLEIEEFKKNMESYEEIQIHGERMAELNNICTSQKEQISYLNKQLQDYSLQKHNLEIKTKELNELLLQMSVKLEKYQIENPKSRAHSQMSTLPALKSAEELKYKQMQIEELQNKNLDLESELKKVKSQTMQLKLMQAAQGVQFKPQVDRLFKVKIIKK